jgi:adenosylcobinamide-GDP ribazoletransferase
MRAFIAALRFITAIPLGRGGSWDPRGMIPHFPLVGLLLGGILVAADALAGRFWSPAAAALVDVVVLVGLTGAFHLDGLADTADGLYGARGRERALEIMKDSRIGAMGMIAVAVCLALKWAGISGLGPERGWLLLLVPAYARAAMVVGIRFLPYGRGAEGTGFELFAAPLGARAFAGLLILGLLSLGLGWPGALMLNAGFALVCAGLLAWYGRKLGCITGDMLGAMTEVTEALLFLLMSARGAV